MVANGRFGQGNRERQDPESTLNGRRRSKFLVVEADVRVHVAFFRDGASKPLFQRR